MSAAPIRRRADPLVSLHARGLLAPGDARLNDVLLGAGLQYRALAEVAEVRGLRSADIGRIVMDGSSAAVASERGAQAREKLRLADAAVGFWFLAVLRAVAIDETPVGDLQHLVPEVNDRNAANAVLKDRLRGALSRLADHWKMHGRKHSPLTSWRAA